MVNNSNVMAPLPAPTNFRAMAGDAQVTLSWDEPASDSGVTHHDYRFRTDGDYGDWIEIDDSGPGEANASGFTVAALENGTEHTFELRAGGDDGDSLSADEVRVTPTGDAAPTIASVAVTSTPLLTSAGGTEPDTYGRGEQIEFSVTFSEAVNVTGDPQFGFSLAGARVADYASGTLGLRRQDFEGLWNLVKLDLADTRLSSLPAGVFAGLTDLEVLNLNKNRLRSLPAGVFAGLRSLKKLRLQKITADLTMAMGAAGLRGEVLTPPADGGLALAVKGDARFTRTASEATKDAKGVGNLAAATADVWLVRTGIEGSRRFALDGDAKGMVLTPSFEIGARLDGGDAETGLGVDLGGGLAFAAPKQGLSLDLKARGLIAHESSGFREWGASASLTVLVVDEGSLASTVQARDLLRIADALRIPRVVLVGDEKQLDAVDAGKPFAQLQAAGMKTALMDQIMRQCDPALKEAVEASLAGDIARAFEKLGDNVAEVNPDNLAGAAAARWLALPPEARERTGLMAPSHALREGINEIVRERLTRDGVVRGPAMTTERLASRGYTNAEKALARNYMVGDVVGFHRPYKRLGVEKGDELRVAGVDRAAGSVTLAGKDGGTVAWEPGRIAARAGGVEVYKKETMELRAGDRIRWTRNDAGLGLVNSQTAEVAAVKDGRVSFRLEDGRMLDMNAGEPQLRHIDRAWASTVHAFQGRTVDNVIAAIEANHPNLTNRKMLYVEISRARDRAELVTDDKAALREQIQALTGERITALEALGDGKAKAPEAAKAWGMDAEIAGERSSGRTMEPEKTPAPKSVDRDLGL